MFLAALSGVLGVAASAIAFLRPLGYQGSAVLALLGVGLALVAKAKSGKHVESLASLGTGLLNVCAMAIALCRGLGWV